MGLFDSPRIVLPNDSQRLAIIGATGSGKSHAALWFLAQQNFDRKPWVIYDYKYDPFINSLPGVHELDVTQMPTSPGLYVVHPLAEDDDVEVQRQMRAIWERGNIGVYVDEGYMIDKKNKAFRMLLTQGRSKRIPMMILMQRPVWVDRFVLSESEFLMVFRLNNRKDIKIVEEYVPHDLSERLPTHEAYYYNAPDNQLIIMEPLPDQAAIKAMFLQKLRRMQVAV